MLFQEVVDTRVLIVEVAERHDTIMKLKAEVNELEDQLKQKDTHIHFKDEIIKELRKERNNLSKVFIFNSEWKVKLLITSVFSLHCWAHVFTKHAMPLPTLKLIRSIRLSNWLALENIVMEWRTEMEHTEDHLMILLNETRYEPGFWKNI